MNATIPWWSLPATLVALVTVWSLGSGAYKRTIGRRGHVRRCLNKISCGTTFTHIEVLLGQSISSKISQSRVYRTYRSPYAYVVATAPHAEQNIDGFSITIRRRRGRPRFRFTTERLTANQLQLDLSKSSFGEVGEGADGRRWELGARRLGYTERFYFGNPGHYQTYLLGYNDAAGDEPNLPAVIPSFATGDLRSLYQDDDLDGMFVPEEALIVDLRRQLRVNTLTVLDVESPGEKVLMSYLGTGVDLDDVRRIPE